MVCSKEEFLLFLRNWMSASQSVVVGIMFSNPEGSPSLSTIRLRGYIEHVDPDGELVVIGKDPIVNAVDVAADDFVMLALDNWEFAYSDPIERPKMSDGLMGIPGPVVEGVSLTKPNSIQISIFALAPPSDNAR